MPIIWNRTPYSFLRTSWLGGGQVGVPQANKRNSWKDLHQSHQTGPPENQSVSLTASWRLARTHSAPWERWCGWWLQWRQSCMPSCWFNGSTHALPRPRRYNAHCCIQAEAGIRCWGLFSTSLWDKKLAFAFFEHPLKFFHEWDE